MTCLWQSVVHVLLFIVTGSIVCCRAEKQQLFEAPKLRELAIGDFEALNNLLNGATIRLPDATVATNAISVDMTNVRCTNFRIDDVLLNSDASGTDTTRLQLNLEGLDMNCFLDYRYTFLFTRSGRADMYSYDNRASISMLFDSPYERDGIYYHPTRSNVEQCTPQVNIADLDFHGGIAAIVLDVIERLLRDKVEEQTQQWICAELRTMSQTIVTDTLQSVDKTFSEYISAPEPDPLRSEKALLVPQNVTIVDFQEKESWKKWLDQMLADGVAFLTKQVDDGDYGTDMNINHLIREGFLEDDGSFVLDIDGGFSLFNGHDKFLQSSLFLDKMRVIGLDSITTFEPLVDIGRQTLQNEFSFRFLSLEMDFTMNLRPSTRTDSIFVNPVGDGIIEHFTIRFNLDDLKVVASILLAVDETKLGSVSLGALLDTENIFNCFLSTLFTIQVPALSVSVSDLRPPTLDGFISRGIDRIVTQSVDAAFLMYKDTILEAAPGFFQVAVTDFLNKEFTRMFPVRGDISSQCTPPTFNATDDAGFIDFRDLLLTPEEAKEAGGSGTEPYGDVVFTLLSQMKDQFLSPDLDGKPKVNELIRDFLASRSTNTSDSSVVTYADDVLNTTTGIGMGGFYANVGFRIFDAQVANLDTLNSPIQLLEPVDNEAHVLNNSVTIGEVSKPVRLSARVLITVDDNADLQLRNEVGVSLDLTSAHLGIVILLKILQQPFFEVPLKDTLNLNCWLDSLLSSSSSGITVRESTVSVEDLWLEIGCVSCSSPMFDDLIDMLYSEETKEKVSNFLDLILESDYIRIAIDGFISTASKQCPHTSGYDESASWSDFVGDAVGGFGVVTPSRDEKAMYFNVALAVITFGLIVMFVAVKLVAKRRNRILMNSLPSEAIHHLDRKTIEDREKQKHLNDTTKSMFHSDSLPRHVRYAAPMVILLTIALVLVGHLGVLSTVNVVGQFAGESFAVDEILQFSFFSAAVRTFNNGGVEVAILLFMFAFAWLSKLVVSLALFFLPPQRLSVERRGTILLWLDVFAKLSLPDIFMMLLAVGALMVFFGGADEALVMEGDFFAAKLIVVPGPGFYCIIMAQRFTRILSRYLLNCHNEILASATKEMKESEEFLMRASGRTSETWLIDDDDDEESRRSSTSEHFADDSDSLSHDSGANRDGANATHSNDETRRSITRPAALLFTAASVLILIIIACLYVPAISINTRIIWGLLASGKTFEEAVKEFGMFWMLSKILLSARFVLESTEDYVGLGFLLALVIVTSMASPIMKGISFLRQWHRRRQRRPRSTAVISRNKTTDDHPAPFATKVVAALRRWLRGGKNVNKDDDRHLLPTCRIAAWKDIEVYIAAFVVACWQLGAVAGYAIHIYCYILEKVYDIVVYLGLMDRTSPQCYRVQTSSPIFVGIVFLSFFFLLVSFLVQAARQYRNTMNETLSEWKEILVEDDEQGREEDTLTDLKSISNRESEEGIGVDPIHEEDTEVMTSGSF